MPAVLGATAEPLNSPPRVRLDVTLPVGSVGVSAYVTRVGPDGRTVPVRLADPALIAGTSWMGYDYETPYGVTCTYSAQVVYYATGRTNLCMNPSFEVDLLGWISDGFALVRDTTQAWVGAASGRFDTTPAYINGGSVKASNPRIASPGQDWTASVYVRGTGTAQIELLTYPSSAVVASSGTVALTGGWQRISVTGTMPAGSTGAWYRIWQRSIGTYSLGVDGVLFEHAPSVGAYFDGDTPDTATNYAWAGTPHYSNSTATDAATTTETATDTATVDVADVWLVHVGVPDLSMMLAKVTSLGARSRQVNRGVFEPFGRTMPIVVTDGKRKAPTAQLVIRTRTLPELAALQALTADAATLLLNVPDSLGWGQGAEYIALGDLSEAREVDIGADAGRLISGPYSVVSRPIGGSQAQRTWADLLAECATWQDVLDKYDTWLDVLAPTT